MRATFAIIFLYSISALADPLSEAKEHYRRGTQFYDLGQFVDAASEYQEAFKLTDRPAFLFNIGQAYRLGGKAKDALAAYEGFLRRVPDAPQRSEVEQHIAELKATIQAEGDRAAADRKAADERAATEKAAAEKTAAEARAAENAVVAAPGAATPPRKPLYKKWWLWTVVGIVAAGAATGIAVGVTQSARSSGTVFPPAPVMP
jgi:tetratricopeptide (TPR) repeat protein